MGIPKANLLLNGKRIIDIILDALEPLFDEIFIVTDDKTKFEKIKGVKVIEDLVKGSGPLAGIYTGLKISSNNLAFVSACDMPFLRKGLIKRLLDIALEDKYDCIVPKSSRGIEPLHAVYARNNLPLIERLLKEGTFSVRELFNRCNCKYLEVDQKQARSFVNLNTPQDLKEIMR